MNLMLDYDNSVEHYLYSLKVFLGIPNSIKEAQVQTIHSGKTVMCWNKSNDNINYAEVGYLKGIGEIWLC